MLSAAEATTKCKFLVDLVRGCQALAQGTSSGIAAESLLQKHFVFAVIAPPNSKP
jgi:hypothetical protein